MQISACSDHNVYSISAEKVIQMILSEFIYFIVIFVRVERAS